MSVEIERMRTALDLHDLGVKLYRQRLRRQFPEDDESTIDARVRTWLAAPSHAAPVRTRPRGLSDHSG